MPHRDGRALVSFRYMSFPLPPPEYDIHSLSLILNLRETKDHNQLDAVASCMDPPFLCERFLNLNWGAPVSAVLAAAPAKPSIRLKTDERRQARVTGPGAD